MKSTKDNSHSLLEKIPAEKIVSNPEYYIRLVQETNKNGDIYLLRGDILKEMSTTLKETKTDD
jgi:hypothetical protein